MCINTDMYATFERLCFLRARKPDTNKNQMAQVSQYFKMPLVQSPQNSASRTVSRQEAHLHQKEEDRHPEAQVPLHSVEENMGKWQ